MLLGFGYVPCALAETKDLYLKASAAVWQVRRVRVQGQPDHDLPAHCNCTVWPWQAGLVGPQSDHGSKAARADGAPELCADGGTPVPVMAITRCGP